MKVNVARQKREEQEIGYVWLICERQSQDGETLEKAKVYVPQGMFPEPLWNMLVDGDYVLVHKETIEEKINANRQ